MAKVLIVDDHAANRELIVQLLAHRGHEPLEAADGLQALAEVRRSRPALVICDLLMPTMDGYEFVRQLRADSGIAATEVVFYTATFLGPDASELARSCGVTQVLHKPCEPEEVLAAIDRALAQDARPAPAPDEAAFGREHRRVLAAELVQKAEQLEHANKRLSALIELNVQLASERDPEALLEKVCRGARELIGARYAVLGVKDPAHEVLVRVTTAGMSDHDAARLRQVRIDVGMPRKVMEECVARRFYNPPGDPLAVGLSGSYPPVHSGLIVPVASPAQTYGWILLIDKLGADSFSESDERLLAIHAAQAGRIYESGTMYRQAQRHAERLQTEIGERQAAADRLRESELRFRQLAENIREVFFLTSADATQVLYVSPAYAQVWGRSCESLYARPQSWDDATHPDDRERVRSARAEGASRGGFDCEYRIVRPDGGVRWIGMRGFAIRDVRGAVYRIAGIAEDITERIRLTAELREREAGLARAQALARLAHVVTRADGSFESWSESLPRLAGVAPEHLPASTREWLRRIHPDDRAAFRAASLRAGAEGAAMHVDYRLQRGNGEWVDIHQEMEPLAGLGARADRRRWFSTLQDVTEQKLAARRLLQLDRVHSILREISALIVRARSREELFAGACRIAVDAGAYRLAWIGTIDAATQEGRIVAWHGDDGGFAATVRLSARDDAPNRDRPANRALRLMQPVISNDLAADATLAPLLATMSALGLRSQACFPLLVGARAIGVLTFCAGETNAFDEQEVTLLRELADDIAFAFGHLQQERLDRSA